MSVISLVVGWWFEAGWQAATPSFAGFFRMRPVRPTASTNDHLAEVVLIRSRRQLANAVAVKEEMRGEVDVMQAATAPRAGGPRWQSIARVSRARSPRRSRPSLISVVREEEHARSSDGNFPDILATGPSRATPCADIARWSSANTFILRRHQPIAWRTHRPLEGVRASRWIEASVAAAGGHVCGVDNGAACGAD